MKLARAIAAVAVSVALAAPTFAATAAAAPPLTEWQPVVSGNPSAIGRYRTISQPTNVTGVVALLPTTNIPGAGAGTLSWTAATRELSWRSGAPVVVSPTATASYSLPEPATGTTTPPQIIVNVKPADLPSQNANVVLNVTSAQATAGFDQPSLATARDGTVFNGDVYLGFENGDGGTNQGEVWRSADGLTWVKAAPDGFGMPAGTIQHIDSFIVFGGQLYAGTDSGQIWRTSNGTLWTLVTSSPGYNENLNAFAIFNQALYANQANSAAPGGVFRSSNGASWSNVFQFGKSQLRYTHDLTTFNGSLFSSIGSYQGVLGAGGGAIASSADGTTWHQSGADGFGNPANSDISGLAVLGTHLYAATFNPSQGAEVWRTSDGTNWQQVASGGFGDPGNTIIRKLTVFGGDLYAGTDNDAKGGEIWRTENGTTWTLAGSPGFGMIGKLQRITSFFTLGSYLYATAQNDCSFRPAGCGENGWELWRTRWPEPTCTVTAVRRAGEPGFPYPFDQQDVTVQAPGGLAAISNVSISNGTVAWPTLTPGTTAPVTVTATKAIQGTRTQWSFDVADRRGNTIDCA